MSPELIELRVLRDALQLRNSELVGRVRELERDTEARAVNWVRTRVGPEEARRETRSIRLLEEALELAQAEGVHVDWAHNMVEHVFGRPAGDPLREAAAVASTLYAYCGAVGVRVADIAAEELARNEARSVEDIQASLARKRAAGLVATTVAPLDAYMAMEREVEALEVKTESVRRRMDDAWLKLSIADIDAIVLSRAGPTKEQHDSLTKAMAHVREQGGAL